MEQIIWKGTRTLPCKATGALKLYKVGTPTDAFWEAYRIGKESLIDLGYTVEKVGTEFEVRKPLKTLQKKIFLVPESVPNHPKLKPSQQNHFKIILASILNNFAALDGSQTGLGKTYVALAVAEALQVPTFVICPKTIIPAWFRVAKIFHVNLIGVGNYECFKNSNTPFGIMDKKFYPHKLLQIPNFSNYIARFSKRKGLDFESHLKIKKSFSISHLDNLIHFLTKWFSLNENWVENYEFLVKEPVPFKKCLKAKEFSWILPSDCLVIWDEVHKCGSKVSQNSKMLIASKPFKTLCLSATAIEEPQELKALGYIFDLHHIHNFSDFLTELGAYKTRFKQWEIMDDDKQDAMLLLHNKIYGVGKGSRMTWKDDPNFPETQIEAIAYESDKAEIKEVNEFYTKLSDRILTLRNEGKQALLPLVERMKFRRMLELKRVPIIVSEARNALENGFSVVIFCGFRETLFALSQKLKCESLIYGEQKSEERQTFINNFQQNKTRLLISTVEAGGTGVELHDLTGENPRYAIITPIDKAKDMRQVFGRVHRSGGKSKSLQRIIYMAGTVEEKIAESLNEKLKAMDVFNDGILRDADFLTKELT